MKPEAQYMDVEHDPIHMAAAEWLLRLQDPRLSLEDTLAWQDWMKASPQHAQAFASLEEISEAAVRLRPPKLPHRYELARDRYDGSTAVGDWFQVTHPTRKLAIAASVLLVLGALLGMLVSGGFAGLRPGHAKILTTEIGENRTVPLEDGSRVTLGGNSRVEVNLSNKVRAIALQRGEAFFVVAKDPTRPFEVRAGAATVTAVGTEFNVRRESDRVVVAVTEGRVIVEPASRLVPMVLLREFAPKLRAVRVGAGETTLAGDGGIEDASKLEDVAAMTSWQSGRLAFHLQPLKYVLQDVNRYAPKPIVLDDETIGALSITGTVERESIPDWVSSLERAFDLQAIEEPERIVLRRARNR